MENLVQRIPSKVKGYGVDSRKIGPDQVFFALKGERADGHAFLREVAAKGALAAVVSKEYQGESFGLPLIPVEDVLASLQGLARDVLAQRRVKIVGITGSVGKTTTKEFTSLLLEARYRVGKSPGNGNSQIGFPLGLLNMAGEKDILVLEMGMSEADQIKHLVSLAPPDVAVMTKVGTSHAAFFPNGREGIAAAKAEIFSHPNTCLCIMEGEAYRHYKVFQEARCQKIILGSDYQLRVSQEGYRIEEKGTLSPPLFPAVYGFSSM